MHVRWDVREALDFHLNKHGGSCPLYFTGDIVITRVRRHLSCRCNVVDIPCVMTVYFELCL